MNDISFSSRAPQTLITKLFGTLLVRQGELEYLLMSLTNISLAAGPAVNWNYLLDSGREFAP